MCSFRCFIKLMPLRTLSTPSGVPAILKAQETLVSRSYDSKNRGCVNFVLHPQQPPCVLQPKPELHKAFMFILNLNHNFQFSILNSQNLNDTHDT